jgi:hypothetical protein
MAILQLKFHNLVSGDNPDVVISREKQSATIDGYTYSLAKLSMKKEMYRPTEILADINILAVQYNDSEWKPIGRAKVESMFKHKQVTVNSMNTEYSEVEDVIGDCFYVHEVIPEYYKDKMLLKLKIYSLDKLMTLKKTCRTFVGKRLGEDILANELKKFVKPYETKECIEYDTDHLQQLRYKSSIKNAPVEHIFPYLVQYNESFYDMLARTTNRWGEFMYFEKGKLQFGYEIPVDENIRKITLKEDFYKITYPNQDTYDVLTEMQKDGKYDCQALYDKTIDDTPVQRDPYLIRGELFSPMGLEGQVITRIVSSLLNSENSLQSTVVNNVVDESVSYLKSLSINGKKNDGVNDAYLSKTELTEQNGKYTFNLYDDVYEEKDGFNEFTEIKSSYANADEAYTADRYMKTLAEERKVSKNVAVIDYDTTWPGLKLGQVIDINDEMFIVAGITANTVVAEVEGTKVQKLVFRVTAISQAADGKFYPAELPTGHVRYSGPQTANIVKADDPSLVNRVRVSFPWQGEDSTPWIPFAAKGDGKPSTGRHNKGTNVMVGFVDGNVERPYVMGAIQDTAPYDGTVDIDLTTPNEHYMRLTDATNKGVHKMALSILSPTMSGLWSAIPGLRDFKIPDFEGTNTPFLDGGFTLSDYYGMYKISGSSIGRNISISSPFGDVKMDAFTGITISAPNGDVKIKGKNVTIEAGNNLKLTSGTNIKKYFVKKPESAWALLDPLTIAAERLLKEVGGIIDFTFLRHVAEVQFKPVEGVTEIKSNRYLKLESGGSSTGYPDAAYKDARAKGYKDLKSKDWYKMGKGIGALIGATSRVVNDWLELFKSRYDAAYEAKQAFDKSIGELRYYANFNQQDYENANQTICNGYTDLTDLLYNAATEKITVKDLAFKKDKVGFAPDVVVSDDCFLRCLTKKSKVRKLRRNLSLDVLKKANALLKAIQALKRMELSDQDIQSRLGSSFGKKHRLPKNYMDAVKKAFSSEKCSAKSTVYTDWLNVVYYAFTDGERNGIGFNNWSRQRLALKRLVSLNLLDELGFSAKQAIPGVDPVQYAEQTTALSNLFASEEDLIDHWEAKINSIKVCNTSIDYKTDTGFLQDKIDELSFKQVREKNVWSDAKSGKILFSSGGKPQLLDGTIKDINAFYSKGKLNLSDALDSDLYDFERFNNDIKDALERLSGVQGWHDMEQANQNIANQPIQQGGQQGGQNNNQQGGQDNNQQEGQNNNQQEGQNNNQIPPVNNDLGGDPHNNGGNNNNNHENDNNNDNQVIEQVAQHD